MAHNKLKDTVRTVFSKNYTQVVLIVLCLIPFYFFLSKIFTQRALSFGCFDDCANYMAGYFMTQGRELYSEIFYNHIMGMAHLSYAVQIVHPGINIYDLVLSHRQVILLIAFILNVLIIKRFGWVGVGFVVFYELSKFYIFGDRFLAESIVVYVAVYLSGLIFKKLQNKKLLLFDYLIAGLFSFLIMYLREPYIPLSIFLYIAILWGSITRQKIISMVVFIFLAAAAAASISIPDFIFNDFTVNMQTAIKSEAQSKSLLGVGLIQMFLNPVLMFTGGIWSIYRIFQIGLSFAFICGILFQAMQHHWKIIIVTLIMLGLSNIRIVEPGVVYYEAYHGMVWGGMLIFIALALIFDVYKKYKKTGFTLLMIIVISWGYTVFSPGSYLYHKIDLQEQLLTNFGHVMNIGTVIQKLSDKNDTVFLDGADDMIIWQSKLNTPYKYSWYTSVMPQIPLYRSERITMFKTNPPDFYYDFCSREAPLNPGMPGFVKERYQQLYENGKPSCLYVLKSKIPKITSKQWESAAEGFYTLPENGE